MLAYDQGSSVTGTACEHARSAHDSGLKRFANRFPCGSFIRYSMAGLTDAFDVPFSCSGTAT